MRKIKDYQELEVIFNINKDKLVIVDFFATWCGPCRMLSEMLNSLSDEELKDVIVVKVDVDESEDLMTKYSIRSIPTMIYFKNGEMIDRTTGGMNKETFLEKVNKMCAK